MEDSIINDNFVHNSNYKRIYSKQNMDYEEKYKKTLEKARKELQACGSVDCDAARQIFRFFPELKESEDEKIKKKITALIEWSKSYAASGITTDEANEMLAWLEKQGEQKPADKVKPKFKVGDWITNGEFIVGQIISIGKEYYHYICNGIEQPLYIPNTHKYHLWTIQDAKDGDVIYSRHNTESFEWIGIFKSLDKENKKVFFYGFWHDMAKTFSVCRNEAYVLYDDFSPATKEQRDILFAKMKEAGYEWDVEKKELKKVEQKSAENEELTEFDKAVGVSIGTWNPKTPEQIQSVKSRLSDC